MRLILRYGSFFYVVELLGCEVVVVRCSSLVYVCVGLLGGCCMKNGVLLDCACLGVFLMVSVFMGV